MGHKLSFMSRYVSSSIAEISTLTIWFNSALVLGRLNYPIGSSHNQTLQKNSQATEHSQYARRGGVVLRLSQGNNRVIIHLSKCQELLENFSINNFANA